METEWVLRRRYALGKDEIAQTISGLLDAMDLNFEDEASVEQALHSWRDSTAEFADCLIGAHHRALGCRATASFDARAHKLPDFVSL